jgi:DNA-directed RNA polymerase subunit RPC12/RpoP
MSNISAGDRVEVPPDAFLRVTGQLWKLVVASLILPWPAVVTGIWIFRRLGSESIDGVPAAIGFMVAIAAVIVLLLASVKCPQCGTRLVLRVFRDPDGLQALTAMLNSRVCPQCGHRP